MPILLAYAEPPAAVAPVPSVITAPDWALKPVFEDVTRLYPKGAAAKGVEGRATITCTVGAEGRLHGCEVSAEEPASEGFGEAALKLSSLFKMRPMTRDGRPVAGGVIHIPIRFVLPPQAIPAAPADQSFALTTSGPKAVKWLEKPNAQELEMTMARYAKAWDGRVVMSCIAAADGRFAGCRIESETPAGLGFGAAALSVVHSFKMSPTTADGVSVAGGTITVPIHFYRAS